MMTNYLMVETLAYAEAHVVSLSIDNVVIGIDEAGDHIINNPGDVINYLITVNNNGDVDLHNVHVSDSLIDNLLGSAEVLKPGETLVYTVNYTVTYEDATYNNSKDSNGFIVNTVTVSGDEFDIQNSSTSLPINVVIFNGIDEGTSFLVVQV